MAHEGGEAGVTPTRQASDQDAAAKVGLFTGNLAWITLGSMLLIIAAGFEVVAVAVVMPTVVQDLHALGWYSAGFAVTVSVAIVGIVIAGPWGDQRGPRGPLLTGVVSGVTGLLVAGFAHSMPFFLMGRAIQGLGIGLINVSVYVLIGREMPAHLHSRIFSLTAIGWVLPALLGPIVAGVLVDTVGWRWVFWGVAPIMVVASIITLMGARTSGGAAEENMSTAEWRGRLWRALVIAIAIGSIQPVGELARKGSAGYIAGAAVGVVALLAIVLLAALFLLPRGTIRLAPGLPSVIGARLFLAGSYFAFEAYIPLLGQEFRGFSPTHAGLLVASGSVAWAIASVIQSRLPEHASRYKVLTAAMACGVTGISLAITLVNSSIPIAVPIVGWAIAGFGVGIAYPLQAVMTLALSKPDEIGWNSSALSLAEQTGTATSLALGGVLFGALIASHGVLTAILAYTSVPLLYGLGGVVAGARSRRSPQGVTK